MLEIKEILTTFVEKQWVSQSPALQIKVAAAFKTAS